MLVRGGSDGNWRPPKEGGYGDEADLRDLIAGSPSLLPGVGERPVAVVTELGVPAVGQADVVVIDAGGEITIVECKLGKNPEIRRWVIGQVFSYAGGLWQLGYDDLERAFAARNAKLTEPFTEGSDWDETTFRDSVAESLANGSFRLVIAVDDITDELKRTVLYINRHTVAEVRLLALELSYAHHEGVEILLPEVYGEESADERPAARKWDEKSFLAELEEKHGAEARRVAQEIIQWTRSSNWRDWWGVGKITGHFCPSLDHAGQENFMFGLWTSGEVEIRFGDLADKPPFDDMELRREFRRRLNEVAGVSIPEDGIDRFPTFELDLLASSPEALDSFKETVGWLSETVRAVEADHPDQ